MLLHASAFFKTSLIFVLTLNAAVKKQRRDNIHIVSNGFILYLPVAVPLTNNW